MAHTVQPGHPVPTPAYDPEQDPVLASLRGGRKSGGRWRGTILVFVILALGATGWLAYRFYGPAFFEGEETAPAETATPVLPVISPRQEVEAWCAQHLGGTEFDGLPVHEGEVDEFYLIYTARPGDSIAAVARRYLLLTGDGSGGGILDFANRQHRAMYGGRGLWVGDEVRLQVTRETAVRD